MEPQINRRNADKQKSYANPAFHPEGERWNFHKSFKIRAHSRSFAVQFSFPGLFVDRFSAVTKVSVKNRLKRLLKQNGQM
jgi:hypothetical protein